MSLPRILPLCIFFAALTFTFLAFADEKTDTRLMLLLHSKDFNALDTELNAVISGYSLDFTRERELDLALDTFYRADPSLEPLFTEWVSVSQRSSAAYLSRGIFYSALGWAKRGTKYYNDSTKEQLDGMQYYFGKAFDDLENAKKLNNKLLHALCYEMEILMNFGDRESVKALKDSALRINPYSVTARWYYISSILPRWGGSIDQIKSEVALAKPFYSKNPALKIFDGRVSAELGDQAYFSNNYAQAIQYYSDALRYGNHWYYNKQRGEVYSNMKEYALSNKDLDIAIELRPNYPRAYYMRGINYYQLGDMKKSIDDFSNMFTSDLKQPMAWDIRGDAYLQTGNISKALSDFEIAVELDPANGEYRADVEKAKLLLDSKVRH
jgi:tetratricopeptide (TPR) repeat protein